jgi:hypothetical protein
VERTSLHRIAEAPLAAAAFAELASWMLGPESTALALHDVETTTNERIRELARLLLQEHVDVRGTGDLGPAVDCDTGDGSVSLSHRRLRTRQYLSLFGPITVTRQTYGQRGCSSLAPLDEEIELPARLYSYPVQQRLATGVARGPFAEAVASLQESAGVEVGAANVDDLVMDVAQDFDAFYAQRAGAPPTPEATVLVAAVDGKGVVIRPARGERLPKRARGAKGPRPGAKREARVAAVYAIAPFVRTPADILGEIGPKARRGPRPVGPPRPRPQQKRVWASLEKSKDDVFAEVAEEMRKRDPGHRLRWVCVTDGDPALQKRALRVLGAEGEVTLILDLFHVTEYLWDAGRAFHREGAPEVEAWVEYYLEKLLYGEASEAARGMRQSATKQGLRGTKREAVDAAASYILRNREHMKYDEYLAAGLPIGTGVAEGTCRHLVKDRMERTGMRWTITCAEAVLKMRAVEINGDTEAYWEFHIGREQERLHAARSWRPAA